MNAPNPWPPESWSEAAVVASRENAIRARAKFGQAAPEKPKPWRRWAPDEMDEKYLAEMTRRQVWGYTPPAPGIGVPKARSGFYRASSAEHKAADDLGKELDDWFHGVIGFDPKIGNPRLDNSTARIRTPEELQAMIRDTRARAPRMFRSRSKPDGAEPEPLAMTPELVEREQTLADERQAALARRMASGGAG